MYLRRRFKVGSLKSLGDPFGTEEFYTFVVKEKSLADS
jgi:hypothetical protein